MNKPKEPATIEELRDSLRELVKVTKLRYDAAVPDQSVKGFMERSWCIGYMHIGEQVINWCERRLILADAQPKPGAQRMPAWRREKDRRVDN